MDDPETLEYEVTFRYFSDYTRSVNMHLANDASALEAAYKRYKSDFERRGVLAFFNVQKDVEWFRERYHPGPEMTQLRENCKRKGREGKMQRFLDELEGGQLDALTLDLGESCSPFVDLARNKFPIILRRARQGGAQGQDGRETYDGRKARCSIERNGQ